MKRGERMSDTLKEKVLSTKHEIWVKSLDWDKAKSFMDVEFTNGSRNNKSKPMTFRTFKGLVDSGKSILNMSGLGYSIHLGNFMSSFLRGNIKLSIEKFKKQYVEEGLSLDEISRKNNISREGLTYLRELYQIKAKGANYQKRKRTEVPITPRQRQIIIGGLLGDGGKMSSSITKYVHGGKQKDYLLWKFDELKNLCSDNSLRFIPYITESGKEGMSCRFYTKANSDIEKIISLFYVGGRKTVTREILDQLEPLGLAIWFMDDGKVDFGIRYSYNITPEVIICTDSFSEQECELIRDWFLEVHKIESTISRSSKRDPRIRIKSTSVEKFFSIVKPHVLLPCFDYKIQREASAKRIMERRAKDFQNSSKEVSPKTTSEEPTSFCKRIYARKERGRLYRWTTSDGSRPCR